RANERTLPLPFDLIELNGDDLRRDPLDLRKAMLASIVAKARPGIRFQRAHGRRRPDRLRPRLQDGARRHRVEGQGVALPLRPFARLAQNEELGGIGREARSGRGLESAALVGSPGPDGAHFFQFTSLVSLMSSL